MQGTEQFKLLARIRNGVETVPSILRRIYHADRMPVRGLTRTGFFFGCKVAALNVKKLLTYHRGTKLCPKSVAGLKKEKIELHRAQ